MKKTFLFALIIAFLLGVSALFLFVGALARTDMTYPAVYFGDTSLGLSQKTEAKKKISETLSDYLDKPLLFAFEGEAVKVTPRELNVLFDADTTFHHVPFADSQSPWSHFWSTLRPHFVKPVFEFEIGKIQKTLEEKFQGVKFMHDAYFQYDKKAKTTLIIPEQTGITVDQTLLVEDFRNRLETLGHSPIFLHAKVNLPALSAEQLEKQKGELLKIFPKKLSLRFEKKKWELEFPRDIGLFRFENRDGNLTPVLPEKQLETLLEQFEISKELEFAADGLKMYRSPEGKVAFEGHGKSGRKIERNVLAGFIQKGIREKTSSIEIPTKEVEPPLDISDDLRAMGIRENLSRGYTTYYGSPANRMHNIRVGVEHYNGTLVAPGEIYSFNENLGPVDASTGYKEELVIKHDGTKPEFGGGLCQVSTTFYRGVLFAGLPIVERSPHSYAVTYYSQVLGHGLDATIYPGSRDLKFLNDTPGFIVVHAYAEDAEAHFDIYGTNDGRKVYLEGPIIGKRKDPPPDEIVYTKTLADGKRELKEKSHPGFEATWYRYVTKKDEIFPPGKISPTKEVIFSRYKAMPKKYLVGGEGPTRIDPALEAAKQFE